jgi:TatD DNase family protein
MPRLIDTHCHLHFPAYVNRAEAEFLRMREQDVWAITVGTTAKTSQSGVEFARAHDGVFATVGYHPEHLTSTFHDEAEGEHEPYEFAELEKIAQDPKVVGIGETGLDFFRIDETYDRDVAKDVQEKAFRQHIRLAQSTDKPLVIHCREALDRLAQIIQDEQTGGKKIRGVVHCFTGSWEEAKPLLDLGLHISFTGIITFPVKKSQDPEKHAHRVIERMPLEKLMIETDAPWLAPEPFRGKQNEPIYVEFVARKIAQLRGMEYEEVAKTTTETALGFFGL